MATCHPPSCGGLRSRRPLVSSSAAALLLLVGSGCGPSLPSTCHAFTSGANGARNGVSMYRRQRYGGFVPLVQPFHNHPGTKPTHHVPAWVASRYRSSSATTSNIQHLNLATLSTDEGQGEAKIPTDDNRCNTRDSLSGDTSIDKRRTRTTKGNGKRRPPPNKRTSLKWVVESVETCLCNEKGYRSEYSSHLEDKSDALCDWKEQDLQLVDALWELCWGELSLNSIQCLETLVALLDFIYKFSSFIDILLIPSNLLQLVYQYHSENAEGHCRCRYQVGIAQYC